MKKNKLLIVEDNRALALALSAAGERCGFEVVAVPSLALARKEIGGGRPDVILLDLGLPDGSGLELLGDFEVGDLPMVAMLTAHGEIDHAIAAKKAGVEEFFVKPVDFGELEGFLQRAVECVGEVTEGGGFSMSFIGTSPRMRDVFQQVAKACSGVLPVVVRGESGSGRSHVAHLIHEHGAGEGACVVVDCDGFSGDWGDVVARAASGSVVLDGVDGLLLESQVLLEKAVAGSSGVRWIAIVGSDGLRGAVSGHAFHPDLYYRLQGGEVVLPSLRERLEDFRALCGLFLAELDPERSVVVGDGVYGALMGSVWDGNLRELKGVLRFALMASEGRGELLLEDFPEGYRKVVGDERVGFEGELERWVEAFFRDGVPEYREVHEELEGMLLEILLDRFEGNQAAMARALEMNRATLRKKLKKG